ncbi:hypothetical protein HYU14_01325 [Candidatus Woesearchaeota archaeon]|nr:hypothetical protein [Candidatus Woesearchaeota archaeon]
MSAITQNEMDFVLTVFKSPESHYNANSIAKLLGISRMGALKIAKRLTEQNILIPKEWGKAKFYSISFDNAFTSNYLRFMLEREIQHAHPYVKVLADEMRKIKSADAAILFGSVLNKHDLAKDIDILLITDKRRFQKLKQEVVEISRLNAKRLHPVYQTKEDFVNNIKKEDAVLINALKGIVLFGWDVVIDALRP